MKRDKKKIIILSIIIVILVIIIALIVKNKNKTVDVPMKNDYGNKNVNTNIGVIEDKKLEDVTFTNTSMIEEDGVTTLTTTVTNTSKESKYIDSFKIYVKDSNDKVIVELLGYVGATLSPNEQRIIRTLVTDDITNAYSIEYRENK